MKRSIYEVRRLLEEGTHLNPAAYRKVEQELTAAEAAVKIRAGARVQSLYDDHVGQARDVSQGFCTVRDDARKLTEAINSGRISPTEAAAQLEGLRAGLRAQRPASDRLGQVADQMDAIEADPVAWHESLADTFPHMRHEFSF